MRGRILVTVLTLGLMGAGAGGVMATGGGPTTSGVMSATSEYPRAHCHEEGEGKKKHIECTCPDHSQVFYIGNTAFCRCPDGTTFNKEQTSCHCPEGQTFDNRTGRCVKEPRGEGDNDAEENGKDTDDGHGDARDVARSPVGHSRRAAVRRHFSTKTHKAKKTG